jgi:hypothetical protein
MHDEEYPCKGCLASNPFPRYSGQFNGHLLFNTDLEELHQYLLCERIKYRETVEVTNKTADKSLVSVEARIFVPDRRPFSYLSQPSCNLYSFIKREGYRIFASLTCSKLDSWRYAYNAFETRQVLAIAIDLTPVLMGISGGFQPHSKQDGTSFQRGLDCRPLTRRYKISP